MQPDFFFKQKLNLRIDFEAHHSATSVQPSVHGLLIQTIITNFNSLNGLSVVNYTIFKHLT